MKSYVTDVMTKAEWILCSTGSCIAKASDHEVSVRIPVVTDIILILYVCSSGSCQGCRLPRLSTTGGVSI